MTDQPEGFCTRCNTVIVSFDGLTECPACGTRGVPCLYANQVRVEVNWHELRILVMWAENWANHCANKSIDPTHGMGYLVLQIARRIENQHPDRALTSPLTLAGELRQLADTFGSVRVVGDEALDRSRQEYQAINDPPKEEPQ